MKRLYAIILFIFTFSLLASAQDSNVTVIGSGDGNTKTNALNQALRSCIEKSLGAFLSSSTTVSNDSLVKDEIISIASGNIVSYDVISEINTNDNWNVTVSAIISPEKIVATLKSKGYNFELNGGVYAQNILKETFYAKEEAAVLENFLSTWENIPLFDFDIDVFEPKIIKNEYFYDGGGGNIQFKYSFEAESVLRDKFKESYLKTADSYKSFSILLENNVDKELEYPKELLFCDNNRSASEYKNAKYVINALFTPRVRKEYLSFVNSLISLLANISIQDINGYKELNANYFEIAVQLNNFNEKSLNTLNDSTRFHILKHKKQQARFENPYALVFYLRNPKNLAIFLRLNDIILSRSTALNFECEQCKKLTMKPQLYSDSKETPSFKFCSKSGDINPYYYGYQFPKRTFRPTVLAIFLTFEELQSLKQMEFKPKSTNVPSESAGNE